MTDFVLPPPVQPSIPVEGRAERFAVRRVICIGRNYGAHVREMGGDPKADPPIFFAKYADTLVPPGASGDSGEVRYPGATSNLHHEIELVVALKGGGTDLTPEAAAELIWGYSVGVDLTRRDRQTEAKDSGGPWEVGKSFEQCAPIGFLRAAERAGDVSTAPIRLSVNGAVKQSANLSDMIWSVPEVIAAASRFWFLGAGDLIFTGTPEGVGPLVRGDRVEGSVEGVGSVAFTIT